MPIAQHTSHSLVFADAAAATAADADAVVATKRRSPQAKCKENEEKKEKRWNSTPAEQQLRTICRTQFPWSEDERAKEWDGEWVGHSSAAERKTCLKQMAQQNIKLWLHVICGRREKFTDRWNNNNIFSNISLHCHRFRISFLFVLRSLATSLRAAPRSHHPRFALHRKMHILFNFVSQNIIFNVPFCG